MRAFLYYFVHTFLNSFKKLFRTWVAAFLAICLLFGVAFGLLGAFIGSKVEETAPSSEITEEIDTEPQDTQQEQPISPPDASAALPIIEMCAFFVPLLFVLIFFYTGDKSGASIFTLADVNLLFVSPMRPQSVLLFRTVLQMGAIALSSVYLMFQIPNLTLNLGLSVPAAIIIVFAFVFCIILGLLTSVCTYTVVATDPKKRKAILPITVGIVFLLALILFTVKSFCGETWFGAMKLCFASTYSRFVPVFGWMAALVVCAAKGEYLLSGAMFLLIAAAVVVILYGFWKIKADFYEDALSKAAERQQALDAAAEGRQARKKARKRKFKESEIGSGQGANTFFFRDMYTRRKFGIFGALSKRSATYLLISLAVAAFLKLIVKTDNFISIPIILMGIHFFMNFGSPLAEETRCNFIFMIPESNYKKVFYLLLSGVTACALDLIPAFLFSAILLKSPASQVLVMAAVFVTYDVFISASGLATEMMMPKTLVQAIKNIFCVYIRMILVMPGLALLLIGAFSGKILVFGIITAIINVIGGSICYIIGSALLRQ